MSHLLPAKLRCCHKREGRLECRFPQVNNAVKLYRDVLGLTVRFESPGWNEDRTKAP